MYLCSSNFTGGYAHLFTMSQLNGKNNLIVAASYGTHQVLILPMLFEQLFHIA